jgi:phosphoribosylformylglycinamidine (FGAM) synthase-like enzyme
MGTLVRACEACRDAALAYRIPFISGKDSLHNQFTNSETGEVIKIPATLLISAIGVIEDVRKCITMDLKRKGSRVVLIESDDQDLTTLAETSRRVASLIATGRVASAHDVSEGGIAVAAAEMCIASAMGLICGREILLGDAAFDEKPGRYLLELTDEFDASAIGSHFKGAATVTNLGIVQGFRKLTITTEKDRVIEVSLDELTTAWRGTLDW